MNDLYELGAQPVDIVAARLLMKSPWWALVPEKARYVLLADKKIVEIWADVTKEPPINVPDRRGESFYGCVVIGFDRSIKQIFTRRSRAPKPTRSSEKHIGTHIRTYDQSWYVLFCNGVIATLNARTINRYKRIPYEAFLRTLPFQNESILIRKPVEPDA